MKSAKRISKKRNTDDSVFSDLFKDKKNILTLYRELTGDMDKTLSTEDIDVLSIEKVFINDFYNDLGFVVKDEIFLLVEAQSTYTKNITLRLLFYVARTLEAYLRKKYRDKLDYIYDTRELEIPNIKLYNVYTGSDEKKLNLGDHYIYLEELIKSNGQEPDISLRVKVMSIPEHENLIGQYIEFCRLVRKKAKEYDKTEQAIAIKVAIEIAIKTGILSEYLKGHKYEVVDMMAHLITGEEYIESLKKNRFKDGLKEGEEIGEARGLKKGKVLMCLELGLSYEEISEKLGISEEEIKKIEEEIKK